MNQTNKIGTFITNAYKVIVAGLFSAIMAFLVWSTFLFTVRVNLMEKVYYLTDAWWLKLLTFLVICTFSFFASKSGLRRIVDDYLNTKKHAYSLIRIALLFMMFLLLLVWIKKTLFFAWADSGECLDAARELMIGDFNAYAQDGYVTRLPVQIGLIWAEYLFMKVVGITSVFPFQLINALCIIAIYFVLSDAILLWSGKKSTSLMMLVFGFLFLPLLMYVSFVYGNIPGLSLSLVSMDCLIRFFRKGKIAYAVAASLTIAGAIMLKSNFWIFFIAMAGYVVVKVFKNKKWIMVWPIVVMLALGVAIPKASTYCIERLTHEDLSSGGETLYAWVVMGLSEDGVRAPGWCNDYHEHIYNETNHNLEAQKDLAKEAIKDRIKEYAESPKQFHSFMCRKMISQWAEPTYECFWLIRGSNEVILSDAINRFVHDPAYADVAEVLDVFPWAIYIGALACMLLGTKESGWEEKYLFALTFVGGFLFHLFWEAKSQYALLFVVVILPLALEGYRLLGEMCFEFRKRIRKFVWKENVSKMVWAFLVLAFLVTITAIGSFRGVGKDNEEFTTYIETTDFYE